MKSHKLATGLIAICLLVLLCSPAFAATQSEEEVMSKLDSLNFIQEQDGNRAQIKLGGEQVSIENLTETPSISELDKVELVDAIENVLSVRYEEFDDETEILNYYYYTQEHVYFYEEAADHIDDVESRLVILDLDTDASKAAFDNATAVESAMDRAKYLNPITTLGASTYLTINNQTTSLDKGVAARLNIWNPDINYMSVTVPAPRLDQIKGVDNMKASNFIYLGFSGPLVEADIGLMAVRKTGTDTALCGFGPFWALKNNYKDIGRTIAYHPNNYNNQTMPGFQYYYPSDKSNTYNLYLTLQKNYGGKNGTVRGSVSGLAYYSNLNGRGDLIIKSVMDSVNFSTGDLKPITKWKAVNTLTPLQVDPKTGETIPIASGTASQNLWKDFLVNGNDLALSTCDAEIYNKGNTAYGSITATYKNKNYLDTLTFILKP